MFNELTSSTGKESKDCPTRKPAWVKGFKAFGSINNSVIGLEFKHTSILTKRVSG